MSSASNCDFKSVVAEFEDTEIMRVAKAYYAEFGKGTWEQLDDFSKFTWLSFAERLMSRDN